MVLKIWDRFASGCKRLKDNLTGFIFNNLDWQFMIFEGKDHNNSDISALLNGLNCLK